MSAVLFEQSVVEVLRQQELLSCDDRSVRQPHGGTVRNFNKYISMKYYLSFEDNYDTLQRELMKTENGNMVC